MKENVLFIDGIAFVTPLFMVKKIGKIKKTI